MTSSQQLTLIDLPKPMTPVDDPDIGVPDGVRAPAGEREVASLATLATMFEVLPDAVAGIVRVDPRAIMVDPVNVRHGIPFNAEAQGELIASMRAHGNTVPVRLRPNPAGGPGYLCPSGSQRLGAGLHIQRDVATFRLRAIIAEQMSDREAFALGEADNAGRKGVPPMQQARKWAWTLANVYDGDRQAFIAATGTSASVVSRTLALTTLPFYVLACCADPEVLTPYFSEQLVPRLGDPAEEPAIRRRAEALIAAGRRASGAKLIRLLLEDAPARAPDGREVWRSGDGSRVASFRTGGRGSGGRIELPLGTLTKDERRALIKAIGEFVTSLPTR